VVGESDLLVALHLCRITRVELDVVIGWRRSGLSWDAITRRCRRDAAIYYVELPPDVTGPPYGRACAHWRNHPRRDLQLGDAEIRELVLVNSLSRHTGMPAAEVVRLRAKGQSARSIGGPRDVHPKEDTAPRDAEPKKRGGKHGKGK
jgi:hypothetical protein